MSVEQSATDLKEVRPEPSSASETKALPPRIAFIGLGRTGSRLAWRLADAGVQYPRVVGGYKAMRRFLTHSPGLA